MAATITEFLQRATSLYQRVLHLPERAAGDATEDEAASHFIRDFEILADRLGRDDDNNALKHDTVTEHNLVRACWKISQDIILRLKRLPDKTPAQAGAVQAISIGVNWVSNDAEVLGARILDLSSQWKHMHPEDGGITSAIQQKLASLSPFEEQAASSLDQGMSSSPSITKPSPATSSGILIDFILESLSFKSMKNRQEEVAVAHGKTFDWVFKHDSGGSDRAALGDQFTTWLRSDELGNIYWVTGKPGAGKSTLMRHIAEHVSTTELLKLWADDSQLARAVFYFWTSGSEEQRSQTGLLRYLLHQLLSYNLELTPIVFSDLWQKLSSMTTKERIRFTIEWNVAELMNAFQRFVHHALKTMKICLFVDGLDEFDGDHQAIINFFRGLAGENTGNRIKLCLSSRPWPIFEQAFQYSVPNLKLQELTSLDMKNYVHDNLAKNSKLKKLLAQDREALESLTQDIVQRAEGVFLWVRLVVRKLLELYGNDPNLTAIRGFTSELPSDLDDLFDRFLFRKRSKDELQESAHIFRLVHARELVASFIKDESANSLSIWEIVFALAHYDNKIESAKSYEEVADDEIWARCGEAVREINTRSTGLLEIYTERGRGNLFESSHQRERESMGSHARKVAASRVTYLHRTVRDYLISKPGIWESLVAHSSTSFDPHLRLLQSHVLRLKHSIEPLEHHRRLDEWYPDIVLSLSHARYVSTDQHAEQTILVNQLDQSISWYWLTRSGDPCDHWARSCFGSYERRKGNKIAFKYPFLALCTKFGLEHYVLETLDVLARIEDPPKSENEDEDASQILEETPLLSYALEFLTSRQKTIMPFSSPEFIKSLLRSSHIENPTLRKVIGTPNMSYDSPLNKKLKNTPWISVLGHLRDARRRGWIEPFDVNPEGTERWTKIVKVLVQEGQADLNAFLHFNGFDKECHAQDILVGPEQLGTVDDWWIHDFKSLSAG
ncbi:putative NACHT domain-containing protein [Seiridium unicorne]|uniref:NACHT domain-containing protein n=1 Tax=Seiridium unicorne TaxID=138068 RepID=A0ABR2VI92_9PEZI